MHRGFQYNYIRSCNIQVHYACLIGLARACHAIADDVSLKVAASVRSNGGLDTCTRSRQCSKSIYISTKVNPKPTRPNIQRNGGTEEAELHVKYKHVRVEYRDAIKSKKTRQG